MIVLVTKKVDGTELYNILSSRSNCTGVSANACDLFLSGDLI